MNWHERYLQQAAWTRDLRLNLLSRAGTQSNARFLEVGCGTGAILQDLCDRPSGKLHGLDIDVISLRQCSENVPRADLVCGDALHLPYASAAFDIVCCHFLLLWVADPLRALMEMRRVTRRDGYVMAFAEPDYAQRVDKPAPLEILGRLQTEALRRQGANPLVGSRLAQFFQDAGLRLLDAGRLKSWPAGERTLQDFESEWEVLREDLGSILPESVLAQWMTLDAAARAAGDRVLEVPTYFALAQV